MEDSAQLLQDSLLVIWNDRDPERRLAAMQKTYSENMKFFESNSPEPIVGFNQINELISKLQSQWAPDFAFEASQPAQTNNNIQFISWTLGAPGKAPVAKGADVAVIENGKIKSLHLFLEKHK